MVALPFSSILLKEIITRPYGFERQSTWRPLLSSTDDEAAMVQKAFEYTEAICAASLPQSSLESFSPPVFSGVLDDAQRVDPHKSHMHFRAMMLNSVKVLDRPAIGIVIMRSAIVDEVVVAVGGIVDS